MLFPGNFKVSGLMFRSLIHFEFIFVYGVRSVLTLSFHMWLSSFLSTICGRDWLFPIVCFGFLSCRLVLNVWFYLWAPYSVSLTSVSVFVSVPHCLDYSA